jgi:long-subunit acyl-CoA synthetase (AMP-forming)
LKKIEDDLYQLYVKSPFGHKAILNDEAIYNNGFFKTGDLVRLERNNGLIFFCRENRDFFKTSYGAKAPISLMKNYYKDLYQQVLHIEYFNSETFNIGLGVSALIFIDNKKIPTGRVHDKEIIDKYKRLITKTDKYLKENLEPFEYQQRRISRFLLINGTVNKTAKGDVSLYKIENKYKDEISDLLYSTDPSSHVCDIECSTHWLISRLIKQPVINNRYVRRFFLQIFLWLVRKGYY